MLCSGLPRQSSTFAPGTIGIAKLTARDSDAVVREAMPTVTRTVN